MHIILGLLGGLVTVLVLLNRLAEAGISLGGLNPFLWHRRRKWQQQQTGNPIFHIDHPMDATALVLTAAAKVDGDLSSEQKNFLIESFEQEFKLSKKEAAALSISSAYLLGAGDAIEGKLEKVLAPSLPNFNQAQADSAISLLDRLCALDASPNPLRQKFVEATTDLLRKQFEPKEKWD
ncbi:MAG: hypothetical protein AB8B97_21310 [Granulosicoccus sp.]